MIQITKVEQLKPHQIRFIMKMIGCTELPIIILEQFEETYGQKLTMGLLKKMDPINNDLNLDAEYIDVFNEVRSLFTETCAVNPVASKIWRVQQYQRMADYFQKVNNQEGLLKVMELTERETDRFYEDLVRLLKMSDGEIGNDRVVN